MALKILLPIFFLGLLTLQAQILFFRELLVSFQGNELGVGFMLLFWLGATGLGSLAGGRLLRKPRNGLRPYFLLLGLALGLPAGLMLLRCLPAFLGFHPGETLPLTFLLAQGLLVLGPFCLLSGILFPLLCLRLGAFFPSSAQTVGRVYGVEALGAALGGVLGVLWFPWINGLTLAFLVGAGLSACALGITRVLERGRLGGPAVVLPAAWGLGLAALSLISTDFLDPWTRSRQWRPYEVKHSRETPFGSLILSERAGQTNLFFNGIHQFSFPDPGAVEEKTHLPLVFHRAPQQVFLLGGGISGILGEVLKHPSVQGVDCVELDQSLVEAAVQFRPDLFGPLHHPSTNLIWGDGRTILGQKKKHYDLILMDFAGPDSLLLNRFYTREFFQIVKAHLNPEGLFAFSLAGATDMMGPAQTEVFRNVYLTLARVFPGTLVLSGEQIHFLGFPEAAAAAVPVSTLRRRLGDRNLMLQKLDSLKLEDLFSPWRRNYLTALLTREKTDAFNQDLTPTAFFYQTAHLAAQHHPALAGLFAKVKGISGTWLIFLLVGGVAAVGAGHRLRPRRTATLPVLVAVATAGFSTLALEIMILVLFQIFLGYLYLELGALIAAFMLGLAGGAAVFSGRGEQRLPWRGITAGAQVLLAGVCLLVLLLWSGPALRMEGWSPLLLRAGLYSLMFLVGLLGGAHYFLCSRACLAIGGGTGKTAGRLYGLDLLGAALGSLAATFMFLPLWGFKTTLLLLGLLNLAAAGLLYIWRSWTDLPRTP